MRVVITATTEKGDESSIEEVKKTFKDTFRIAKSAVSKVGGRITFGKGFYDGTEIVLEK